MLMDAFYQLELEGLYISAVRVRNTSEIHVLSRIVYVYANPYEACDPFSKTKWLYHEVTPAGQFLNSAR